MKRSTSSNKIIFIILARMSSKRLPGKMMMDIAEKPLLWYSLNSIQQFTDSDAICVATSENKSDDAIADYCEKMDINCFRGDLHNPAKRFRNCLNTLNCDYAVRICGDNVFVVHSMLNGLVQIIDQNNYDFISNTKDRTFPYGMSIEAVRKEIYLRYYPKFQKEEGDFEHIMPFFYRSDMLKKLFWINDIYPEASGMHLAVDSLIDLNRIRNMLVKIKKPYYMCSLKELHDIYE